MSRVVRVHEYGGPEVLRIEQQTLDAPGQGQVRLRHTAIGVNFADISMLQGRYLVKPPLPTVTGLEGAGVVEAIGPGVTALKVGDRVCYTSLLGAFADERLAPAEKLFRTPEAIDDKVAAAVLLKGMTACYLLHETYAVKAGETVLIHAAAGGVGTLLCQWASHIGARVVGTVGSDAKVPLAKANGCAHVVNYAKDDFAKVCLELTAGKGVDAIYDSVGKDAFEGNMTAIKTRGYFINFGLASGHIPPIDAMRVNAKSMYFNKSSLVHYYTDRASGERLSGRVFEMIGRGVLRPGVDHVYPLADIVRALSDVNARKTTGSVVLVP
jgi:NADPH2:quinone reductase